MMMNFLAIILPCKLARKVEFKLKGAKTMVETKLHQNDTELF